jgi:hypothetical protein
MTTIQAYNLKLEIIKLILENKPFDEQLKLLAGHYHVSLKKSRQIEQKVGLLIFLDSELDMDKRLNTINNLKI